MLLVVEIELWWCEMFSRVFLTILSLAFFIFIFFGFISEWLIVNLKLKAMPFGGELLLGIYFFLVIVPHLWLLTRILFPKDKV